MLAIYYGHRIANVDKSSLAFGPDIGNVTTPESLEAFLSQRRAWTAVSVGDLGLRARGLVSSSHRYFALTFDDGYLDNYTTLLPLLERFSVPATIFVTTAFVSQELEPYEYVLARLIESQQVLSLSGGEVEIEHSDQKAKHYERLRRKWKALGDGGRRVKIHELSKRSRFMESEPSERYLMNWDEVVDIGNHPLITIGSHSHTHPLLTAMAPTEAFQEMRHSRSLLEERLQRKIGSFAYPYGSNNVVIRSLAKRAGFRLAFSTEERQATQKDFRRPWRLPRFDLSRV